MGSQVRVQSRNVDFFQECWQVAAGVKWNDVHDLRLVGVESLCRAADVYNAFRPDIYTRWQFVIVGVTELLDGGL